MNRHPKALALVGSARKHGNTSRLVDEVLRGFVELGGSAEKVYLSDYSIRHCLGCPCYVWKPKRPCIQTDDLAKLGNLMEPAQLILISTPIYWYGPSGLFKNFLDRWIGLPTSVFAKSHVAAVLTMQDTTPDTAGPTEEMLRRSFTSGAWITYEGSLLASGLHHTPDAITSHPQQLDEGYQFGRSLAEKLR